MHWVPSQLQASPDSVPFFSRFRLSLSLPNFFHIIKSLPLGENKNPKIQPDQLLPLSLFLTASASPVRCCMLVSSSCPCHLPDTSPPPRLPTPPWRGTAQTTVCGTNPWAVSTSCSPGPLSRKRYSSTPFFLKSPSLGFSQSTLDLAFPLSSWSNFLCLSGRRCSPVFCPPASSNSPRASSSEAVISTNREAV